MKRDLVTMSNRDGLIDSILTDSATKWHFTITTIPSYIDLAVELAQFGDQLR